MTLMKTVEFICENYDRGMTRLKLYAYRKRGWFEVFEYPGTPRISRKSVSRSVGSTGKRPPES
jgi:hypothetical protein